VVGIGWPGAAGEVYASVTRLGGLTWHTVVASQLGAPFQLAAGDLALDPRAGSWAAVYWDVAAFAPARAPVPAFAAGARVVLEAGPGYADAVCLLVLAPLLPCAGVCGGALPCLPTWLQYGVAAVLLAGVSLLARSARAGMQPFVNT
jgi:hypothetical protein